jgi:uncharacterized phage protein gp47/JayE
MSYSVPNFRTLLTRVQTDLGFGSGSVPARSIEYVLSFVIARVARGLYAYQTWAQRQVMPDTAEDLYFWRFAAKFGITQKPATPWEGTYTFTGTGTSAVPDNTELQRADGQLYNTVGAAAIGDTAPGEVTVTIVAQEASAASSCDDGQTLSLAGALTGVDTDGTVVSTLTSGSDVETKDEALPRLLYRLANPPRGGGPGDYVRWALEVPGVTRAWEFPLLEGPNSVSVAFARDDDADPVPGSGARATVLAYLQSKAPVTVDVRVITLVAAPLNLVFSALSPNTSGQGDAIKASVTELLLREGAPGGTLALSRLDEAISESTGEISHTLSSPSAGITWTTAQLPVMGTITRP